MVDPARWRKIEDVFGRASDMPAAERAAFVAKECGGDEELRREVMALLEGATEAGGALHGIVGAGPRPVAGKPRPAKSRRAHVAVIVTVVIVLGALGYAAHVAGTPDAPTLTAWTLHVEGADYAVTLPSNFYAQMGMRVLDYSLETELAVREDQRGHELTLHFDCFHTPLAASVDGEALADIGDTGVGEHRFVIPASDRAVRHVTLAARRYRLSVVEFGTAPYITAGVADRSVIATLNRAVGTAGLVLNGLLIFMFGLMYLLDRRRQEYVAWAIGSAAAAVQTFYYIGVLPNALLPEATAPGVLGVDLAMMMLAIQYIVHDSLGMPRPTRVWPIIWCAIAALAISATFLPTMVALPVATGLAVPTFTIYMVVACFRHGTGERRADALVLMAWAVAAFQIAVIEGYWRKTGVNLLSGLHGSVASVMLLGIAEIAVIARQFTARQRTIEHTADELRRQVAERSKELAEALSRLSERAAPLGIGSTIGERYRIVRQLGSGGMGTVYEVERTTDGKRLALKTLRDKVDPKLMARLAREGQLAAELQHPNVVPVVDVGLSGGALYLVMELIEGGSLDDQRERYRDAKAATPLLAQIARGLAALHARGIVHRDLKPANILISAGVPRIADFGIAAIHGTEDVGPLDDTTPHSPRLTRAGDVFGTPMYMAPELASGAASAAPSSDIFSFGVICCELVTGRSPFSEPPVLARLHDRPLPTADLSGLEPPLRELVERCLDLDPAKRPAASDLVL